MYASIMELISFGAVKKSFRKSPEEVGFENYSYFGKLFKRYIGQTPEAYRDGSEGKLGI
ncbi:AraC family transcriptional regulator [Hominenteromicrobium mulieris]|uniref:AraC family transcriptional regulator n=2 Tax=Hominenteromicrobium mulieris TaxID=2885357 RepID=UPI003D4B21A0